MCGSFPLWQDTPLYGGYGLFKTQEQSTILITSYLQFMTSYGRDDPQFPSITYSHPVAEEIVGPMMKTMYPLPSSSPDKSLIDNRIRKMFVNHICLFALALTANTVGFGKSLLKTYFKPDCDVKSGPKESDKVKDNVGMIRLKLPDKCTPEEQQKALKTIDPTPSNFAKIANIGFTREYYNNVGVVFNAVMNDCGERMIQFLVTDKVAKELNAKPSNACQRVGSFLNDLMGGVFDSWEVWHSVKVSSADKKSKDKYVFVNELFFIWPWICGSTIAQGLYSEGKLKNVFHGEAAKTFRTLVTALGFNEETYPYNATGANVLRIWKPNFNPIDTGK